MIKSAINLIFFVLFICTQINLSAQSNKGFFDFEWSEQKGELYLYIEELGKEFIYVNSLAAGLGSNDIGLDRGQLGSTRIVKFVKQGAKILLMQPNLKFRAVSENLKEQQAVQEAFAESVLWGFKIEEDKNGIIKIKLNDFLLRDAHGIANSIARTKQGKYSLDKSKSALFLDNTISFPENTEFEAILTFKGNPTGEWIRSVSANPNLISVRMHHSFVKLPDDRYRVRKYDSRSGYFARSYYDYAQDINKSLEQKMITRHRLEKKNPNSAKSEAIEPIIYYLDPGCPEPIKSALIDGASWWNEAFEAVGFINAFQVKILPEGAHPLDVRYNMIQWVHRSTRGWSYGSSVSDPRTGEIIKGHVSLGSLRVRQDYLIAQAFASLFKEGDESDEILVELALARLRQLSAHEIGHTLGLSHNYTASGDNRASVMDYPHPFIQFKADHIDFSEAYDTGIGEWDIQAIKYGYTEFDQNQNEEEALQSILDENRQLGLSYLTDQDARPTGSSHPFAHLWDNGRDAVEEFIRFAEVRKNAIAQFGESNIPTGISFAKLEDLFVPLYLSHRYQIEAVAKLIGGIDYNYAFRGDGQFIRKSISEEDQIKAMEAILMTLRPSFLHIPNEIRLLIPPRPAHDRRHRELFPTHDNLHFDPFAAAESSINHSMSLMMHPARLSRIIEQYSYGESSLTLNKYFEKIYKSTSPDALQPESFQQISFMVQRAFVGYLINLAKASNINQQVSAEAHYALDILSAMPVSGDIGISITAHETYLKNLISQYLENPSKVMVPELEEMPPGSPIGCGHSSGIMN